MVLDKVDHVLSRFEALRQFLLESGHLNTGRMLELAKWQPSSALFVIPIINEVKYGERLVARARHMTKQQQQVGHYNFYHQ